MVGTYRAVSVVVVGGGGGNLYGASTVSLSCPSVSASARAG